MYIGVGITFFLLSFVLTTFGHIALIVGCVATFHKIFAVEALASWSWAETIGMWALGFIAVFTGRVISLARQDILEWAPKGRS